MRGVQTTDKAQGSENSSETDAPAQNSKGSSLRFNVNQLSPSQDEEEGIDDHSPRMDFPDSQTQPASDESRTIGYATHDAIPMTVFYRNENSASNSAKKSRPTLKELRRGFEEDHEQQVLKILRKCLITEYVHSFFFIQSRIDFARDEVKLILILSPLFASKLMAKMSRCRVFLQRKFCFSTGNSSVCFSGHGTVKNQQTLEGYHFHLCQIQMAFFSGPYNLPTHRLRSCYQTVTVYYSL